MTEEQKFLTIKKVLDRKFTEYWEGLSKTYDVEAFDIDDVRKVWDLAVNEYRKIEDGRIMECTNCHEYFHVNEFTTPDLCVECFNVEEGKKK